MLRVSGMGRLGARIDVRIPGTSVGKRRCNQAMFVRIPAQCACVRRDDWVLAIHRISSQVEGVKRTAAVKCERQGQRHVLREFIREHHCPQSVLIIDGREKLEPSIPIAEFSAVRELKKIEKACRKRSVG